MSLIKISPKQFLDAHNCAFIKFLHLVNTFVHRPKTSSMLKSLLNNLYAHSKIQEGFVFFLVVVIANHPAPLCCPSYLLITFISFKCMENGSPRERHFLFYGHCILWNFRSFAKVTPKFLRYLSACSKERTDYTVV